MYIFKKKLSKKKTRHVCTQLLRWTGEAWRAAREVKLYRNHIDMFVCMYVDVQYMSRVCDVHIIISKLCNVFLIIQSTRVYRILQLENTRWYTCSCFFWAYIHLSLSLPLFTPYPWTRVVIVCLFVFDSPPLVSRIAMMAQFTTTTTTTTNLQPYVCTSYVKWYDYTQRVLGDTRL